MPKITKEEAEARRNEIIDACEALYREESYRDITMTQVGERVSFGRANVYNYFRCKDEILLALLQREHERWIEDLVALRQSPETLDAERIAEGLAESIQKRTSMLKLLAMNVYDIEQNSRTENLVEFKRVYGKAIGALEALLRAGRPAWDKPRIERFVYAFVPFTHGVYPFVYHSEKQLEAMEKAHVAHPELDIRSLVYTTVLALLADDR